MRVAFVTSHPIQYQVPVFRYLAAMEGIDLTVLFAQIPDAKAQGDGFGVSFEWDLPLLEGYRYEVLHNVSKRPRVTSFSGCDTPEIKSKLKALEIDVVIVNGWGTKSVLQALWASRRLGIPCIVRGEANHLRKRPWWKKAIQKQLIKQFSAFLPIGRANRDFYTSYGIPEEAMFAAPYCIENSRFIEDSERARREGRTKIRQYWGIAEDDFCFIYCGKFEEKKHPLELLQSFDELRRQVTGVHLLMVGDGVLRSSAEEFVSIHNLPVTFAGFLNQSQIVDAYVASDMLVLPSDAGETWGLVVNEAMACGIPGIVSDLVGCAQDLVVDAETGWVFPFGNWSQLTQVMQQALLSRDSSDILKTACREKISRYSPKVAASGIADAGHAVLAR